VQHGPGFHLDCDVGPVVEPMDHRVYATVEHGQEDMEAPAGLCDQVRPNQKLACLTDGVLAARGPTGIEVRYDNPRSRLPLPISSF
jgi:hypothetical protein